VALRARSLSQHCFSLSRLSACRLLRGLLLTPSSERLCLDAWFLFIQRVLLFHILRSTLLKNWATGALRSAWDLNTFSYFLLSAQI